MDERLDNHHGEYQTDKDTRVTEYLIRRPYGDWLFRSHRFCFLDRSVLTSRHIVPIENADFEVPTNGTNYIYTRDLNLRQIQDIYEEPEPAQIPLPYPPLQDRLPTEIWNLQSSQQLPNYEPGSVEDNLSKLLARRSNVAWTDQIHRDALIVSETDQWRLDNRPHIYGDDPGAHLFSFGSEPAWAISQALYQVTLLIYRGRGRIAPL